MFFAHDNKRKVISCFLLIILLAIHSIKLLHNHSNVQITPGAGLATGSIDVQHKAAFVKSFQDCTVCSYQPAKDADDKIFTAEDIHYPVGCKTLPTLTVFSPVAFPASFESRGPPPYCLIFPQGKFISSRL